MCVVILSALDLGMAQGTVRDTSFAQQAAFALEGLYTLGAQLAALKKDGTFMQLHLFWDSRCIRSWRFLSKKPHGPCAPAVRSKPAWRWRFRRGTKVRLREPGGGSMEGGLLI